MPCEPIKGPGFSGIACTRGRRQRKCECGAVSSRLCDFEIAPKKTCDRPMCARCATNVGPDRDLCYQHAGEGGWR
jgi:hypothetical protein